MTFAYLLSVEGTRDVNARIRSVAFTWLMWLKEPCSQKAFDLCCRIFHRNCDERTQTGGCVTRGVYRLLQRGGRWPSGNHSWRGTPLGWRSRRWAPPSDLLAVWLWLESHFFFFYGLWCGPRTLLTHFWKHTSNLAPRRWLWRALTPRSDNMTSFLLWPKGCRRARLQSGGTRVVSPYRRSPSPPVGHRFELAPAPSALSRHGRWQLRRSHAPGASVSAEVSMTPTCFLALNLSGEPHLINDQSRFGPKLAIPASSLANYLALR